MGTPEVILLLISVAGAAVLLLALRLLAARLGFLNRVPPPARAPLGAIAMAVTTAALLVVLARPPAHAPAASVGSEAGDAGDDDIDAEVVGRRRIHVYEFENWGEDLRRAMIGEQMSKIVLDHLRDGNLNAHKGLEDYLPLGLHDLQGGPPPSLIRHYRRIAPFSCVTGHVSRMKDGRFELKVLVSDIDRSIRSRTTLEKKIAFSESKERMLAVASEVAEEIRSHLEDR